MKKGVLLLSLLLVFTLAGCDEPVVDPDIQPTLTDEHPYITGIDDITIEYGEEFDPLKDVHGRFNDETLVVVYSGEINNKEPGVYEITYTTSNSLGDEVSFKRLVTVLPWEPIYANGVYNYKFADLETRLAFLSAAERYLMENQIGGINLYNNTSYIMHSTRFTPHNIEYLPVVGLDSSHGTMNKDDTEVLFLNDYVGQAGEYTYRSTMTENLNIRFNQFKYETSIESDILTHCYSRLYDYRTNEEKNGYELVPGLADDFPIPISSLNDNDTSYKWRIPIKQDLEWFFHPNIDQEFLNSNYDPYITSTDFVESFKLAIDQEWFRAVSGGGDFLNPNNSIKGVQEYMDGAVSWDEVGIKSVTENDIDYLELEFTQEMSEWNVIRVFKFCTNSNQH